MNTYPIAAPAAGGDGKRRGRRPGYEDRVTRFDDGSRLGAADRLREASPSTTGKSTEVVAGLPARCGAPLRPEQHPVRHEHAHRRVAAPQECALCVATSRRGSRALGLRLGREAPPPTRAVASGVELAA